MNSKAPGKDFEVDIDKAIDMFSNMSKCLDKKWNMHCELQCDQKCEECDFMYGAGNSGQIENAFENVQEWLEQLKMYREKANIPLRVIATEVMARQKNYLQEDTCHYFSKGVQAMVIAIENMIKEVNDNV